MSKRGLIVELAFEVCQVKFLTVDRAIVSRLVDAGPPATRACQAVKVNARYTDQRQHNGLGSHEAVNLCQQGFWRTWIRQRIEIINIKLIWNLIAADVVLVGNQTTMVLYSLNQPIDLCIRENPSSRIDPDPIMRGKEIEKGRPLGRQG